MRLASVLICLLAAPAVLAGKASQRPLRRSAVAFNDCCKGSDIDMSKFLHAGKQFCELAAQFGRFAVPSASEVRRCIQKIEQALHKLASQGSRTHCKTMRALLQAEVAPKRGETALLSEPVWPASAQRRPPACSARPVGPSQATFAARARERGHGLALMPGRSAWYCL